MGDGDGGSFIPLNISRGHAGLSNRMQRELEREIFTYQRFGAPVNVGVAQTGTK